MLLLGAKRVVSSSQTAVAETVDVVHTSAVYPGRSFPTNACRDQDDFVFGKVHPLVDERGFFGGATQEPRLGRERAHYGMYARIPGHPRNVSGRRNKKKSRTTVPSDGRALDQPEPLGILERGDRRVRELVHVLGGVLFVTPK